MKKMPKVLKDHEQPGPEPKKGINWGAIAGAFAIAIAIKAGIALTKPKEPAESSDTWPMKTLHIDHSAPLLEIDVLEGGELVLDGAPISVEALTEKLGSLKGQGRMISFYRVKTEEGKSEAVETAASAVMGAGLPFQLREYPQ